MESGRLITAIMGDLQDARKQVEGECTLRRTERDAVPVGKARLRGAAQRDDRQVPPPTNKRHDELRRSGSRCRRVNRGLR